MSWHLLQTWHWGSLLSSPDSLVLNESMKNRQQEMTGEATSHVLSLYSSSFDLIIIIWFGDTATISHRDKLVSVCHVSLTNTLRTLSSRGFHLAQSHPHVRKRKHGRSLTIMDSELREAYIYTHTFIEGK